MDGSTDAVVGVVKERFTGLPLASVPLREACSFGTAANGVDDACPLARVGADTDAAGIGVNGVADV